MKPVLAAAVLPLLLGCAMPEKDRSPTYELGFSQGCASAAAAGPGLPREPQRNEELYAKDPDYRAGWASGNAQCRAQVPNRL